MALKEKQEFFERKKWLVAKAFPKGYSIEVHTVIVFGEKQDFGFDWNEMH